MRGGGGIGKEIANLLKENNLLIVGKDENTLKKLAKKFACQTFVCDVTKVQDIENLKNYVEKNFAKIDTLINTVGLWTQGEISQLFDEKLAKLNSTQRIKEVVDANVFGSIALIKEIAPILIKNKKGQIININSQSGVEIEQFCPIYNATKHATYSFRQAIQNDLARHNVKITDICPGLVKTQFYKKADYELNSSIMQLGLDQKDVAKAVKYVFDLPHEITIPSLEIRNIKNY